MIVKQLKSGYMENFSYVVGCEKTRLAIAIDPGAEAERILRAADRENLKIVKIVNTHGHGDHTAGNAPLQTLTGAKIIIHKLDADRYPEADILLNGEITLEVGDITFKDVGFSYDNREQVLKGVNFTVKTGRKVAVVGPSGAGKTTLISLLLRFYRPTTGEIYYGDKPASELETRTLRRRFGYVP